MISIVILFCDKDKHYIPNLLKQIKDYVKVNHEVILIDNRDDISEELNFKGCRYYQFGYNPTQIPARKKGIEMAKGDYIWFIDADDSINYIYPELEDLTKHNYDIISFIEFSKNKVIENNDEVMAYNYRKVTVALWNKWVKTDILRKVEEHIPMELKGRASEDSMLVIGALSICKTIYMYGYKIYNYNIRNSVCCNMFMKTVEDYERVFRGYEEVHQCIYDMLTDNQRELFFKPFKAGEVNFFIRVVYGCSPDIISDCIKVMAKHVPQEYGYKAWEHIKRLPWTKEGYLAVTKALEETYHIDTKEPLQYVERYTTDSNGNERLYKREIVPPQPIKPLLEWNYTVSIICLVYDGNIKYLKPFLETTKRVEVNHEIIIVDNRDDKTVPLEYDTENTVIVETEKNLGILDGRRFGFEHSTGDYIWFVDIDDEITEVKKRYYGESDIIKFPAFVNDEVVFESPSLEFNNIDNHSIDSILVAINCLLWNKWIKREVLESAYKLIPHYFCVFAEDLILVTACLKCAENCSLIDVIPMYSHTKNESSVTARKLKTKKDVDRLFIGNEYSNKVLKEFGVTEMPEIWKYHIGFYIFECTLSDNKIKPYFIEKLYSIFDKEEVIKTINSRLDFYDQLKKYI